MLINSDGQILWSIPYEHAQHAVIGALDWDRPGEKQIVFVDRRPGGTVHAVDRFGNELWNLPPQGRIVMASMVDGWSGKAGQSLLLLFRREYGPPVLINGHGEQVAEFPFPPAQLSGGRMGEHFVQHFSALGDGREELFINNHKEIWVYTNQVAQEEPVEVDERLPNLRIYDASFYVGRQ